jgi:hypothetical protein
MPTAKEEVYDEHIFPLMAKVIEICKGHRIPFVFDVALGFENEDDDSQLKCTSCLLEEDCEPPEEMLKAFEHIRPKRATFAAFTITSSK